MIELVNPSSTDKKSRTQSFLQLSLIHHMFLRFVFLFFVSLFIFQKFNLDSRAFLYCAWLRMNRAESKQELWGWDCRQLSRYAHAYWCTGNYPLLFVLGRVRHGSLHAVSEKTVRKTRKPLLNWNERNALKTKYKTILFWFLTKNDTVELC